MKLSSWRAWSLLPPFQLLSTSPLSHRQLLSSQRFGETHSKRSKDPSYGLFLPTTSINGTLESSANFLSFCLTLCWILESVSPMAPRDSIDRVYLLDEKTGFASENWSRGLKSNTMPSKTARRRLADTNFRILMTSNLTFLKSQFHSLSHNSSTPFLFKMRFSHQGQLALWTFFWLLATGSLAGTRKVFVSS